MKELVGFAAFPHVCRLLCACDLLMSSISSFTELAYGLLRSLRTSTVAMVVDRLTPLLHMDPVLKLPPEITSEIFSYLDPKNLLTASLASRSWRIRIFDSRLWRELYLGEGWRVDIDAIRKAEQEQSEVTSPQSRKSRIRHADSDVGEPKLKKRVPPSWLDSRHAGSPTRVDAQQQSALAEADNDGDHHMSDGAGQQLLSVQSRESQPDLTLPKSVVPPPLTPCSPLKPSIWTQMPNGTVKVNWPHIYKQRRRLEENWATGRYTNFQLPHPAHPEESHLEHIYVIQFSGKWLVSGSRDRTVRVWDLESKRLRHPPLVGHLKSVLCLQFDPSPSEDIIISGSSDRNVILWRFSTGQIVHEIPDAHSDSVLNLRFDERYLVTCSKDKLIKIWNRRELTAADEDYPRIHKGSGVTYPSYIVDTTEIPPAMLEADIANGRIQTLPPYTLLMTLDGHQAAVNAIQMDGDEIVSASGDRLIKIWDLRSGACKKTLIGHEKGIACVQFDNRRIISGSNDDTVRIFDHVSGAEVACLHGHQDLVRTVQAGFGDPPGAEETLRLEALAVDNAFRDAQRSGTSLEFAPRSYRRAGYSQDTAGSRRPKDIRALGAKIPPGGGGSKWGRIVSGSYDETIIIWKKDREGKWVVNQRLHQADAAARASQAYQGHAVTRSIIPRAGMPPQPQLQPYFMSQTAAAAAAAAAAATAAANGNGNPVQQPQLLPNAQTNAPGLAANPPGNNDQQAQPEGNDNNDNTNLQAAQATTMANGQQPHPPPAPLRPPPTHHHHHHLHHHNHPARLARTANIAGGQPTWRVFKLQFDARKIICASHNPKIVGWDFACDDEDLIEACQFFTTL